MSEASVFAFSILHTHTCVCDVTRDAGLVAAAAAVFRLFATSSNKSNAVKCDLSEATKKTADAGDNLTAAGRRPTRADTSTLIVSSN